MDGIWGSGISDITSSLWSRQEVTTFIINRRIRSEVSDTSANGLRGRPMRAGAKAESGRIMPDASRNRCELGGRVRRADGIESPMGLRSGSRGPVSIPRLESFCEAASSGCILSMLAVDMP